MALFQTLVEFQRTIYTALAEQIKLLSAEGDWLAFHGLPADGDPLRCGRTL